MVAPWRPQPFRCPQNAHRVSPEDAARAARTLSSVGEIMPVVDTVHAKARHGERITSRIYVEHQARVIVARISQDLSRVIRPAEGFGVWQRSETKPEPSTPSLVFTRDQKRSRTGS